MTKPADDFTIRRCSIPTSTPAKQDDICSMAEGTVSIELVDANPKPGEDADRVLALALVGGEGNRPSVQSVVNATVEALPHFTGPAPCENRWTEVTINWSPEVYQGLVDPSQRDAPFDDMEWVTIERYHSCSSDWPLG